MKSKKVGAKNCSVGANCGNTCIGKSKNCLMEKNNKEIASLVSKIKKEPRVVATKSKTVIAKDVKQIKNIKTVGRDRKTDMLKALEANKQLAPTTPLKPATPLKPVAKPTTPLKPVAKPTTPKPATPKPFIPKAPKIEVISDSELNQDFFAPSKPMTVTAVPNLKTLSGDNKMPPKVEDVVVTADKLGRGVSGIATVNRAGDVVKTIVRGKINIQKDIVNQNLAASLGIAPKVLSYSENQITMERAAGDTVWNSRKMGDKDLEQNARNTAEMALTMHKAGITHNDSHAGNIMYDKETGKSQFIDFGMSKSNASINERFEEYQDRFAEHVKAAYGLSFESAKDYGKYLEGNQ